jgi:hypothetical protein
MVADCCQALLIRPFKSQRLHYLQNRAFWGLRQLTSAACQGLDGILMELGRQGDLQLAFQLVRRGLMKLCYARKWEFQTRASHILTEDPPTQETSLCLTEDSATQETLDGTLGACRSYNCLTKESLALGELKISQPGRQEDLTKIGQEGRNRKATKLDDAQSTGVHLV